jgi:RES domain-containing protein
VDVIPLADLSWKPAYRIIPSRYPPLQLFERVALAEDLEMVMAVESMTNDRLNTKRYPHASSIVSAAFTHVNPEGGRFSDGSFGVFYAARTIKTAIAETIYHRSAFLRATHEPALTLDMRVYLMDIQGHFHDVRQKKEIDGPQEIYDPQNYKASKKLAKKLYDQGSSGIVYDSVRLKDGNCVAVFKPALINNCRQERHLAYVWDGNTIIQVYEKTSDNIPIRNIL